MRTGLREVLILACLWIGGCGGGTTVSKADMGADGGGVGDQHPLVSRRPRIGGGAAGAEESRHA